MNADTIKDSPEIHELFRSIVNTQFFAAIKFHFKESVEKHPVTCPT